VSLKTSPAFVGRSDELSVLTDGLRAAASGRATTVLLEGEAGIGKTTLIERFLTGVPSARVLRASGDESEADVRFAVADQLLRATGHAGAGALDATQHVSVGMSLLEQMTPHETIVLVDDAHLADPDSLRALLFGVRRLATSAVLVIVAVRGRAEDTLPEGWLKLAEGPAGARLRLKPLSAADCRALARELGVPLTAVQAARLREHTGGNPLHTRAVLPELGNRLHDDRPLPAPRSYAQIVEDKVRRLDADALRLLVAAAVLGRRAALTTASALSELASPLDALDRVVESGLIRETEQGAAAWLEFDHPLTRAAIYAAIPRGERSRLHAVAAELVDSDDLSLQHRVDAAVLPDERLQGELERVAHGEMASGRWAAAVKRLVSASRLAPGAGDRERLALESVEAMLYGGDGGAARRLADRLDIAAGPHRDSVWAYLAIFAGDLPTADRLLARAWDARGDASDALVVATIAQRRAFLESARLRGAESIEWARRALELAPHDAATRLLAAPSLALGLSYVGRTSEAHAVLDEALLDCGRGFILLAQKAKMLMGAGDLRAAAAAFEASAEASLAEGLFVVAAMSLSGLTRVHHLTGAWEDAAVAGQRALPLAIESEDRWVIADARAAASLVPLARGDWDVAEALRAEIEAEPASFERHIATQAIASAQLAAARERPADVLAALARIERLDGAVGVTDPTFYAWQQLKADALVDAGRVEEAAEWIATWEAIAVARSQRLLHARLLHARGRLAVVAERDVSAAAAAYAAARGILAELDLPYELALVELSHARLLRRDGKRRAAAALLVAARERLGVLSATPAVARCDQELAACGLSPVARSERDLGRLTPQETAVARLVVSGLTNREVAAQLLLSTKTVEFHLSNVYLKLDLRSRSELRALARAREIEL
jgi:DNA-binding CsgD family transcriptional regulator